MKIGVHTHGYVEYVGHMGEDADVIRAARMSTNKGFKGWGTEEEPGDEKLLKYLWDHKHSTPFEFCQLSVEVSAPIFVFRQWHRHRTMSYNEHSARYAPMADQFYVPEWVRLQDTVNKQGSGKEADGEVAGWFQDTCETVHNMAYGAYQEALSRGVAREQARILLPVSVYSKMRCSANLRNWFHFLNLRLDTHAQGEIRDYASACEKLVKAKFPRSWELFNREGAVL